MTTAITLKSPHELLAIVPFVLGFRPTNSIVVLCLSLDPPVNLVTAAGRNTRIPF